MSFKTQLSGFIKDFASGDAVRHMADKGLSVKEIHDRLDFPLSMEEIGDIVWKRYIEKGVVCLNDPSETAENETYSFEKVQNAYGMVSFKKVKKQVEYTGEYIKVELQSLADTEFTRYLPVQSAAFWIKKDSVLWQKINNL